MQEAPLTQYSIQKNYMRYLKLYYETDFVLDDFAQLQASLSILSTFKGGQDKL